MWQELMVKEDAEGAEDARFSLLSTRSLILFQALVTTGCFIVLGGLAVWHAKLISKGETSIEAHINRCIIVKVLPGIHDQYTQYGEYGTP